MSFYIERNGDSMKRSYTTILKDGDQFAVVFSSDLDYVQRIVDFLNSITTEKEIPDQEFSKTETIDCPHYAKNLCCTHVSAQRAYCEVQPCLVQIRMSRFELVNQNYAYILDSSKHVTRLYGLMKELKGSNILTREWRDKKAGVIKEILEDMFEVNVADKRSIWEMIGERE